MKFIDNKEAVSPVVGVMLMLVVTLIIAGVVSAFGGGLVSTTAPTPQASISSSLTFGDSLKIQHNGGDSIIGSALDVKAKILTGDFSEININVDLKNSTLARTNKSVTTGSFQTGDILKVDWHDAIPQSLYLGEYSERANPGDLVLISVYDKNSGKQIASQTVTVN